MLTLGEPFRSQQATAILLILLGKLRNVAEVADDDGMGNVTGVGQSWNGKTELVSPGMAARVAALRRTVGTITANYRSVKNDVLFDFAFLMWTGWRMDPFCCLGARPPRR